MTSLQCWSLQLSALIPRVDPYHQTDPLPGSRPAAQWNSWLHRKVGAALSQDIEGKTGCQMRHDLARTLAIISSYWTLAIVPSAIQFLPRRSNVLRWSRIIRLCSSCARHSCNKSAYILRGFELGAIRCPDEPAGASLSVSK